MEQKLLPETTRYTLKTDRFSSHSQIAAWLKRYKAQAMPDQPCVIYDIGCAQGMLGQLLEPSDFVLYGVDVEIAAVAQASLRYREVIQANIEEESTFAFPEPPNILVLADVLEHTREPRQCLEHLCRAYLSPGVRVIISLPNVAHLYVRLSLLAGRFEYTERGLMDRTHLRFFTLASALRLVQDCNIVVDQMATTPVPLSLVNPVFEEGRILWPVHRLQAALAQIFKTLLGYQVIIYGTYNSK